MANEPERRNSSLDCLTLVLVDIYIIMKFCNFEYKSNKFHFHYTPTQNQMLIRRNRAVATRRLRQLLRRLTYYFYHIPYNPREIEEI